MATVRIILPCEARSTARCHHTAARLVHDVTVTLRGTEVTAKADGSKPTESFSQFVGKVLDQLSLTAWMPAAMLVGAGALLLQLRAQQNTDIALAAQKLASKPIGIVIVVLFAVVLMAVITQAFSFEAIRLLEGYWGDTRVSALFLRSCVDRHRRRYQNLLDRRERQRREAFDVARSTMRRGGIKAAYIEVLEDDFYNTADENRRQHPDEISTAARQMGWRPHSSPAMLDALDRSTSRLEEYPAEHRILPTKLGNVLRAKEDNISDEGKELESLVVRRYEFISSRLMAQHDQFRDRLDMYCTLVLVFGFLGIFGGVLLASEKDHYLGAVGAILVFILLGVLSYRAAISSARAYGGALKVIAELPEES
jgi:hypothetical protein